MAPAKSYVTNVELKKDLEHLNKTVQDLRQEVKECNKEQEERIRKLENSQINLITRTENLESKVKAWNIGNSIAAAVAATLAAIGISNR